MQVAAVVLVLAGTVVGIWSVTVVARANQGAHIPLFAGRPAHSPRTAQLARGISSGLLVFGAIMATPAWGYWSVLLIIGGGLIPIMQVIWHNSHQALNLP